MKNKQRANALGAENKAQVKADAQERIDASETVSEGQQPYVEKRESACVPGAILTGTPRMTPEMVIARDKRIADLKEELAKLENGPVVEELTDEEKETGLHASNAAPAIPRQGSKPTRLKSHPDYYHPEQSSATASYHAGLVTDKPSSEKEPKAPEAKWTPETPKTEAPATTETDKNPE